MTNRAISQAVIWIFLGTVLIVWFGCGDDSDDFSADKPTVTEDSPDNSYQLMWVNNQCLT